MKNTNSMTAFILNLKKTKLNIVSRRDIFKVVKLKEKANKLLFKVRMITIHGGEERHEIRKTQREKSFTYPG